MESNPTEIQNEELSPIAKIIVAVIGILLGTIISIPIFTSIIKPSSTNTVKEFSTSDTKWTCSLSSNYYEGHCICVVRNNTNNDYSYVSITFTLYDSSGSVITTAIDNTSGLSAKGTWKVDAYYISFAGKGKPAKCSITELYGIK